MASTCRVFYKQTSLVKGTLDQKINSFCQLVQNIEALPTRAKWMTNEIYAGVLVSKMKKVTQNVQIFMH